MTSSATTVTAMAGPGPVIWSLALPIAFIQCLAKSNGEYQMAPTAIYEAKASRIHQTEVSNIISKVLTVINVVVELLNILVNSGGVPSTDV